MKHYLEYQLFCLKKFLFILAVGEQKKLVHFLLFLFLLLLVFVYDFFLRVLEFLSYFALFFLLLVFCDVLFFEFFLVDSGFVITGSLLSSLFVIT